MVFSHGLFIWPHLFAKVNLYHRIKRKKTIIKEDHVKRPQEKTCNKTIIDTDSAPYCTVREEINYG